MAYSGPGKNPFLDDDEEEVSDQDFVNYPFRGNSGGAPQNERELRKQQILEERRRIEERTLQSTHTSLGLLHESEKVGVSTAEELVRQREQLENIDRNLDEIQNTARTGQKHINAMKNIFGSVKEFFTKTPSPVTAVRNATNEETKSVPALAKTIDSLRLDPNKAPPTGHPAMRIRDVDYGQQHKSIDDKIDENLGHMSQGLGRLKHLALGLNQEIEEQNDMIDNIHNKADEVEQTVVHQTRQINRILKK